jgi:hypothetical protein
MAAHIIAMRVGVAPTLTTRLAQFGINGVAVERGWRRTQRPSTRYRGTAGGMIGSPNRCDDEIDAHVHEGEVSMHSSVIAQLRHSDELTDTNAQLRR